MAAIHSATSPELATLRTYPQASKVRCAIITPPVVFQALINQTFSAWDCIYEITYDTVTTGAYTDLQLDMELWIGTSAGACDVGKCRVRKAAGGTKIYIGDTSAVNFMNNYHLTGVLG